MTEEDVLELINGKKITELPELGTTSGDELFPVINNNITYKTSVNAIVDNPRLVKSTDERVTTYAPNGQTAYSWGNHASAGYVKTDTKYTAGDGLTLSGTTFSLPITVSGTGTYIANVEQTANGITVTKGTPPNTNTTYSAGADLTLSGTTFSASITISTGNPSSGADKSVHYKV